MIIDWQAPWWQPWRAVGEPVHARIAAGSAVHEALMQSLPSAAMSDKAMIRFVAQSALPEGMAYEAFIFETKTVPTRDNVHDFFNGLAWLLFPQTKARLNALQYAEIVRAGVQQQRGALRDALTLFDENAALLCETLHAPIIEALRQRDWQAAFQTHRALLAAHPPLLFGHALLEKLVSPYKAITAHVFPLQTARFDVTDTAALDAQLAAQLDAGALIPKPFVPLPVLGVPHWCAQNESADFYNDSTVFRRPAT